MKIFWNTFLLTFSSHSNLVTWVFIGVTYLISRNDFVFGLRIPLTIWVAYWTRHSISFNGITNQKGRNACHWVLSLSWNLKMQVIPLSAYDEGRPSTTLVSVLYMIITCYHAVIEKGHRISFTFWWRLHMWLIFVELDSQSSRLLYPKPKLEYISSAFCNQR